MLLAVTDYCSMGCSHCMSSCDTTGKHITQEQLIKNLDYAYDILESSSVKILMITGGEPFEHPEIKSVLKTIGDYTKRHPIVPVIIATNGYTLANNMSLLNWYRDFIKSHHSIMTQVTNFPEWYPNNLTEKNKYHLSKIQRSMVIDDNKDVPLYPQGRALTLPNPKWNFGSGTKCTNMRLFANQLQTHSFKAVVRAITNVRACVPRINVNGSISLGESRLYPPIGNIDDSDELLFQNTKNCRCVSCAIPFKHIKETNPIAYNLVMGG